MIEIFRAKILTVGRCTDPACTNVHLTLADRDGNVGAVAVIGPDVAMDIVEDMVRVLQGIDAEARHDRAPSLVPKRGLN